MIDRFRQNDNYDLVRSKHDQEMPKYLNAPTTIYSSIVWRISVHKMEAPQRQKVTRVVLRWRILKNHRALVTLQISLLIHYFWSIAGFPDPFVKVSVDGTGQVYTTEPSKATLYPKWNTHYDLFLGRGDSITISVWNHRKIHKKQGGGFLGCVRIGAATIQRLKDTGCKH